MDNVFSDSELGEVTEGPCINTILKNGLIVRHMPNGDIVQMLEKSLNSTDKKRETDRVYIKDGIVIRHFSNLDA